VSTLNINRNKFRENKIRELLKYKTQAEKDVEEGQGVQQKIFDSNVKLSNQEKRNKKIQSAFNFVEKG
jgi:predicted nucleic acid-binding protein